MSDYPNRVLVNEVEYFLASAVNEVIYQITIERDALQAKVEEQALQIVALIGQAIEQGSRDE